MPLRRAERARTRPEPEDRLPGDAHHGRAGAEPAAGAVPPGEGRPALTSFARTTARQHTRGGPVAIGYLGPEGTFTHAAARQLCPGADLTPLGTQAQAIARVEDRSEEHTSELQSRENLV